MNRDLAAHLEELGPEYRAVVDRILAAKTETGPRTGVISVRWGRVGWTAAAAVAFFLALGVVLRDSGGGENACAPYAGAAAAEYRIAHIRSEEAVKELVRTQRADGGWGSDFLTRQNARALGLSHDPSAQLAYRKAVRNLRLRGLTVSL